MAFLAIIGLAWASAQPQTFQLHYTPSDFRLDVPMDLTLDAPAFRHEPDYASKKIVRGYLPLGAEKEGFVGFAIDSKGRTLYLDLNRNLDLTDDADGRHTCADSFFSTFEAVRVTRPGKTGPIPYVLDVMQYPDGGVHLTVRSGWRGQIELGGKRGSFSIVDNLNGVIDADDQFLLNLMKDGDSADWDQPIPAARTLMLDGQLFDLSYRFEGTGLEVTFSEAARPTGSVSLEGEGTDRLILSGEESPSTVVINSPGKEVWVPAGTYAYQEVYLHGGGAVGSFYARRREPLTVIQDASASLELGGPLNNTVEMRRSGRTLIFDYKLTGVGGEDYEEPTEGRRERAPVLTVYRDGSKIASGSFEYG